MKKFNFKYAAIKNSKHRSDNITHIYDFSHYADQIENSVEFRKKFYLWGFNYDNTETLNKYKNLTLNIDTYGVKYIFGRQIPFIVLINSDSIDNIDYLSYIVKKYPEIEREEYRYNDIVKYKKFFITFNKTVEKVVIIPKFEAPYLYEAFDINEYDEIKDINFYGDFSYIISNGFIN